MSRPGESWNQWRARCPEWPSAFLEWHNVPRPTLHRIQAMLLVANVCMHVQHFAYDWVRRQSVMSDHFERRLHQLAAEQPFVSLHRVLLTNVRALRTR